MELIDRWIPNPAHEREELRGVLGEMKQDAGRRPPKRPLERCPPTISASIWGDLRGTGRACRLRGLDPTATQLLRLDGEGRCQARALCGCTLKTPRDEAEWHKGFESVSAMPPNRSRS